MIEKDARTVERDRSNGADDDHGIGDRHADADQEDERGKADQAEKKTLIHYSITFRPGLTMVS